MQPSSPLELGGLDTASLARAFRYITGLTSAYWDAHLDGRLSRFVAPTPEVENTIIRMTEEIWRAVGEAIREGEDTAVVRTSQEPAKLILSLDTASRMLAFVPYAREAGVDVPDDPESHLLLVYLIEEMIALSQSRLAAKRDATPI